MRTRFPIAVLSLFCALAVVASASAATINGVDYVFFAKKSILMEQGAFMDIQGNIAVNDPNGVLEIGAHNRIQGTAKANSIFRGTSSLTDRCEFNFISGPGKCTVEVPGLPLPIVPWPDAPNSGPLGPIPSAPDPCLPGTPVVVDANNSPLDLLPGCYGRLRVNPGRELRLQAGGVYFFTGEVRLRFESMLTGNGATVNVVPRPGNPPTCCPIHTEARVVIENVTLNTLGKDVHPGNSVIFSNVLIYAPDGEFHGRSNTRATAPFEVVANVIILEPLTVTGNGAMCGCFNTATPNTNTITLDGAGFRLDKADAFFLNTTCDPGGFQVACSGDDKTVVCDTSGVPPGTYHVIARFPNSGSYCSEATITK
jgi:hypothetical protein